MADRIKIYRLGDFIRFTETGTLDTARSVTIVHELSIAANHHHDHNILLDLRDTDTDIDMMGVMDIAAEFGKYREVFQNKIAVLIPGNEARMGLARQIKACMDLQGFQFDQFIDFEAAMDWLAD